jgi:hypothetical protein
VKNEALKYSWSRVNRPDTIEHGQDADQGAVDCIGHRAGHERLVRFSKVVEPGAQFDQLWVRGAAWRVLHRGHRVLDRGSADVVDEEFDKPFSIKQIVFHRDAALPRMPEVRESSVCIFTAHRPICGGRAAVRPAMSRQVGGCAPVGDEPTADLPSAGN